MTTNALFQQGISLFPPSVSFSLLNTHNMVIYKPTIYDWIKLPEQDICSFLFSPNEYNQRLSMDRTAVIDGLTGRSLTYLQVKQRAEHLAAAWQDNVGLKQGDIVAVFAPNQYDTVVLYLSLLGAKCTITPGYMSHVKHT